MDAALAPTFRQRLATRMSELDTESHVPESLDSIARGQARQAKIQEFILEEMESAELANRLREARRYPIERAASVIWVIFTTAFWLALGAAIRDWVERGLAHK